MIDGVLCRPCVKCGVLFPNSPRTRCPDCEREYFRLYRQANPRDKRKSYGLFEGVSKTEITAMELGVNAFMRLDE